MSLWLRYLQPARWYLLPVRVMWTMMLPVLSALVVGASVVVVFTDTVVEGRAVVVERSEAAGVVVDERTVVAVVLVDER
jgi:hypothetical protein